MGEYFKASNLLELQVKWNADIREQYLIMGWRVNAYRKEQVEYQEECDDEISELKKNLDKELKDISNDVNKAKRRARKALKETRRLINVQPEDYQFEDMDEQFERNFSIDEGENYSEDNFEERAQVNATNY